MTTGRTATMLLRDGPLDGLEMKWPEPANDFPAIVTFGFYANDGSDKIRLPQKVTHHRYEALSSWSHGPIDPEDRLPAHEVQEYLYGGVTIENVPSIQNLWDKTG